MTRNLNEIERFFNPEPTTTIQPKQVGFKRLTEDAVLPTKAFPTDSGWDLTAVEDTIVEPGETVVVKTGIAVHLPQGYEAQVRPRSGVTSRSKLRVQIGTIDNSYRGGIGVIVDNIHEYRAHDDGGFRYFIDGTCGDMSKAYIHGEYIIRKGDRIAQLVITRLPEVTAVEITELGESDRGGNGFGSTGVTSNEACSLCDGMGEMTDENYVTGDCPKCEGSGVTTKGAL